MKVKFKVGDLVVYFANNSKSHSERSFGDAFIIREMYAHDSDVVYYPEGEDDGEYEVDLRLATKLERVL